MEKVKRVEAKIILQKNDDGHWLVVDSPSGTKPASAIVSSPRNTLCIISSRFSSFIVRVIIPTP